MSIIKRKVKHFYLLRNEKLYPCFINDLQEGDWFTYQEEKNYIDVNYVYEVTKKFENCVIVKFVKEIMI